MDTAVSLEELSERSRKRTLAPVPFNFERCRGKCVPDSPVFEEDFFMMPLIDAGCGGRYGGEYSMETSATIDLSGVSIVALEMRIFLGGRLGLSVELMELPDS